MSKKHSDLNGRQKAAIFLVSLGAEMASLVFQHLEESEVEALTHEIARVQKVPPEERNRVLAEFNELMLAGNYIIQGGVDYAREVLERSFGTQKALDIINRLTSGIQTRPFDMLRRADPGNIRNFIQNEHPQTVSLVLCYLDAQKGALVLGSLPHQIQADVAGRIAKMERISPEILREVERVLERKMSALASEEFAASGGIDVVVEVLNLVDRGTEKTIVEALEEDSPELAEEIKKRMFVFEDIVLLDDRAIQRVLREVDNQELAKALKSVSAEVQEKIFRNMSKRASALLREDMDFMGPVRLKDVEDCQQKVVNVIRKLEDAGEIVVARSGSDEMLV